MAGNDTNSNHIQRLQEYVDQLENRFSLQPEAKDVKKDLRIEMDRRIVYGQPSKAAFRNELSPQQMQRLLEAFQQPVTQGADLSAHQALLQALKPGQEMRCCSVKSATV